MADNELRGYVPLTEDEKLLAEYYAQFENPLIGANVTAKQNTPVGLLTGTVGGNYDVMPNVINPYAEANLYGDGYNVRAAMDEYAKTLSAGAGNDYLNAFGEVVRGKDNSDFDSTSYGGNIGNLSGRITQTPYDTIKSLGYNTPEYGANVSQDSSGTYFDANKNFNMFDGQGILKLFKNPYDEGIEFLYGRDF